MPMKTAFALLKRLFKRSRSVSHVMYPSPSIASAFNRRVAEVVHYFLGVALVTVIRFLLVQPIVLIYFHESPTAEPALGRRYQGFSSIDMPSHGGAELLSHSDG